MAGEALGAVLPAAAAELRRFPEAGLGRAAAKRMDGRAIERSSASRKRPWMSWQARAARPTCFEALGFQYRYTCSAGDSLPSRSKAGVLQPSTGITQCCQLVLPGLLFV